MATTELLEKQIESLSERSVSILAVRAALRMVPAYSILVRNAGRNVAPKVLRSERDQQGIFASFRALHAGWLEAVAPGAIGADEIESAATDADRFARSAGKDRDLYFGPAYAAFAAAGNNPPYSALQAIKLSIVGNHAAALKNGYPLGLERNADRVRIRTQRAIEVDIDLMDDQSPEFLAHQRLWWTNEVAWTKNAWRWLSDALQSADPNWLAWIQWYDDCLSGARIENELEKSFARASSGIRYEPVSLVNETLIQVRPSRQLKFEFEPSSQAQETGREDLNRPVVEPVAPIESIPEPEPKAIQFSRSLDGPIDVAPAVVANEMLSAQPSIQEDYWELREKGAHLRSLGDNRLGGVRLPVARFLELPKKSSEVRMRLFWSRINTLRIHLAAHDDAASAGIQDTDERRLEPMTAAMLKDFVETANIFMLCEPLLIELDASRPGPKEASVARFEVSDIHAFVNDLSTERQIATKEACDTLQEQLENIGSASDSLFSRQGAEFGRRSVRNFVGELLRRAFTSLNEMSRTAKSEVAAAAKLAKEGAYRAAGPALAGGLLTEAIGITNFHAEFLRFVAQHAKSLSDYVVKAFNNSSIVDFINWIARLVIG